MSLVKFNLGSGEAVCVTGGSGFLGSWCVKILLERGCIVHCTTRNPEKAEYLKDLPGANDRLKIFSGCDLLKPGTFDEAIAGCEVVLHTASPFFFVAGSEEKLVRPAVEGTRNVLASCQRAGVKAVALTASTACVYVNYGQLPPDHVYTASDWSPEDKLAEKKNWYCLSKVRAEKLAWDLSRAEGASFKLCVLNPCLIWGPMITGQPHLNTSSNALIGYLDGSKTEVENACKAVVDVRDVAAAHIAAFTTGAVCPRATKRQRFDTEYFRARNEC